MNLNQLRHDTSMVMNDVENWADDYITEEFVADLESAEDVDERAALFDEDQIVRALVYYGNRPLWVSDLSQPGYVGRLYIYNGSTNRPNDPCGTMYRRRIWFYHSPRGTQYRNCGTYWGYQFINA